MLPGQYEVREIDLNLPAQREEFEKLLHLSGLKSESNLDCTLGVYVDDKLVATCSSSRNILKCFAVAPDLRGEGITNTLVTEIIKRCFNSGYRHLFIYTKPEYSPLFGSFGFYAVEQAGSDVVLMENQRNGFSNYLESLSSLRRPGFSGAIVMNCNPFTLGHRYLIEYASSQCDNLHIFIVSEDRSAFPFKIRFRLVSEGTRDLPNVILHSSSDYIISSATFPTYFLKSYDEATDIFARLDLRIFAGHIAPVLNIKTRFVGEEPYCPVTRRYNEIMKKVLPEYGVNVTEVPRKLLGEKAISASEVRRLLKTGDWDRIALLVPDTTLRFLKSEEAKPIISKIIMSDSRH